MSVSCPASTTRRSTGAKAYQEFFGQTHYTFDHKGVHFIVLDNVSDPARDDRRRAARSGSPPTSRQLPPDANIVVFTHRPLFDLYPQWDWATRDGAKAVELLDAASRT